MKAKSLVWVLGLVVLAAVVSGFQGCSQHVKVADLTRDPGKYRDKDVTVSGRVTESFGALGTGAYQLDDGTGKIWIISEQYGVPNQGAEVEATGRLMEGATFGGRSFGTALRETKRRR